MKLDPYESENIIESNKTERIKMAKLWNDWNAINKPVIWLQANAYQNKRLEMYKKLH